MKISIRFKLLIFASLILVASGIIIYAVYESKQKLQESELWVEHTKEVLTQSGNILSLCKDIESSSRGFVITNDSTILDPLNAARQIVFTNISQLRQLTRDNHLQQQRIDSLNSYVQKRLDYSMQQVEIRRGQGLLSAIAFTSNNQGKYFSDCIRKIITAIQQEEVTLLKQRKQANEQSIAMFNLFSVVLFVFMTLFTVFLLYITGKYLIQIKEKEERASELFIANKELAFQNDEKEKRADELIIANIELIHQNEEKEKRSAELSLANKELVFQNEEKIKRAAEFVITDNELVLQTEENEKQLAANKELEAFSYSVSHDLRAPLRHIGGFVDLLIKNNSGQLDVTGLRYLNIISESSHEMGNLIDALLSFSRLSRTELQRTNNNTRNIVNQVLNSFSDELKGRNIEINISDLPETRGDENLITQVWINLISNALKYSRNKEKAIIDIGGKIENDKTIFSIRDNGAGFDMLYADKLFGVFQRLHKARDFEGVGIGLANVNRIIVRHGGTCWAESEVDKGATFFFSIPIHEK